MRKKGTVCCINYVAYSTSATSGDEAILSTWTTCEVIDATAYREIDRREGFKFSLGAGDIDQDLELLIPRSGLVSVQKGHLILLIEVVQGPVELSTDEIFNELVKLKLHGNASLKKGDISGALEFYSQGIALMTSPDFNRRTPRDISQVFVPLYLNKALCCLKLKMWREAIDSCSQVLEVDANNVKAFFRRGSAKLENRELGSAKRDLLSAAFIEPSNAEVRLKLEEISREERQCQRHDSPYLKPAPSDSKRSLVNVEFTFENGQVEPVQILLFNDIVPKTVENFLRLIPKYIGSRVFKVIKSQICQMGDYEYNDGSGGNCEIEPDTLIRNRRFFKDERLDGFHDRKGLVGMANYGPNTNASQFYLTLDSCPHLDGKHVIFGQLVENVDCLEKLNAVASDSDFETIPTQAVTITAIQPV